MTKLYVLIACEESQAETMAFRNLGCDAYSCDIQKTRKHPEWHINADVTPLLQGETTFITQDGQFHEVPSWHLIVAHPPCTYLCKMGSVWMVQNGIVNQERYQKMLDAREFFFKCLNAKAQYVCVENPLPQARAKLPHPTTYVDPSWYGSKYTKKTLYWLRNLPPLMPEQVSTARKSLVHCSRGKYRSRTFQGLANAMAKQWVPFILNELKKQTESQLW